MHQYLILNGWLAINTCSSSDLLPSDEDQQQPELLQREFSIAFEREYMQVQMDEVGGSSSSASAACDTAEDAVAGEVWARPQVCRPRRMEVSSIPAANHAHSDLPIEDDCRRVLVADG